MAILVASVWNPKARLAIHGRKNGLALWKDRLVVKKVLGDPNIVWLHAASVGEFEQGLPVLQAVRKTWPQARIVVSFFSPSGYEARKNDPIADTTGYLPFDHPKQARAFVQLLQPKLVLWVKYEYWFFTLREIARQNIPLLLVSGIFRKDQIFFRWYGAFARPILQSFTHFFLQHRQSRDLLVTWVAEKRMTVSGDTRFDRVVELQQTERRHPAVEKWLTGKKHVVVAGSTWPEDEILLEAGIQRYEKVGWIIAPHEITNTTIEKVCENFPTALRLSLLESASPADMAKSAVLIVDSLGHLKYLYRYADLCYVGGGFLRSGIHNTLEAAVYGKPVAHGPNYQKFQEAVALQQVGGSAVVSNKLEWTQLLDKCLADNEFRTQMGEKASRFVQAHAGATQVILHYIQENRLLTNA
jgi:3-deoxy-D-manno-octulosonic-acid transferase